MKQVTSRVFIEPDGQYTTVTIYKDDGIEGETLIAPAQTQTITAAFNKARDDIASVLGDGVVQSATLQARIG